MVKLRQRPAEFLARPGLPTSYSIRGASMLLGLDQTTILNACRSQALRANRRRHAWWIPRSEIIRFARELFADRPVRLARVLSVSQTSVVALTIDPTLRRYLASHRPKYAVSPFDLALILTVRPSSIVVIDWETAGSQCARDIAARIFLCPDRPKLVGILPEYVDEKSKHWDALVKRPRNQRAMAMALAPFRK